MFLFIYLFSYWGDGKRSMLW